MKLKILKDIKIAGKHPKDPILKLVKGEFLLESSDYVKNRLIELGAAEEIKDLKDTEEKQNKKEKMVSKLKNKKLTDD